MSAEANVTQAEAQLRQAQVNLERTRIVSPVDGYVTNLLTQPGDFVNAGANTLSVIDANSFWVDGYFEETNLAPIRVGDPTCIKLMGHGEILRGHVRASLAPSTLRTRNPPLRGSPRQSDLHVGAPGPAHPGSHSYRRDATGRRPFGRHDRHGRDRQSGPCARFPKAFGQPIMDVLNSGAGLSGIQQRRGHPVAVSPR